MQLEDEGEDGRIIMWRDDRKHVNCTEVGVSQGVYRADHWEKELKKSGLYIASCVYFSYFEQFLRYFIEGLSKVRIALDKDEPK